jgi:hypothetical protein
MAFGQSGWPNLRSLVCIIGLSLSGCAMEDADLPPVTSVASATACYPVNYLRPPFGPPSHTCPIPAGGQDAPVVALVTPQGAVFDAYLPGEASPPLERCVLAELQARTLEPARECDGHPVAGSLRLKYSDLFGYTCMPLERPNNALQLTSHC